MPNAPQHVTWESCLIEPRRFVLVPMPAEPVKGIAEPVVTYAVREGSA
jgi:hypothetical protein